MSHRARIMPWRTLRFNESVCNPYNADFDGDEMNMHVPQTEEARTEALMLMGVQNNLCTPKNGEILVASTQDFLTSSFLITRKDTFYDRSAFSIMCSYIGDAMDPIDLPTPALIKATCPAMEQESLSTEEINETVNKTIERKILKSTTTSGGQSSESFPSLDTPSKDGCLEAFAESLRNFIKKKCPSSTLKLKSSDGGHSEEDRFYLEKVASNISGITRRQLMVFLETCISRYHSKKIEAGTAIGAIGAQSIGEPRTQMTLKTFHFAGVASMNVTLGVRRIIEIIDATKKIITPIITTALEHDNNETVSKIVKGRIERTLLEQVASNIKSKQTLRSASIVITLDWKRMQGAQLSIDAYSVKESILRTPKLKLKEEQIRVLHPRKLEVTLLVDRSKIQFELQGLKNKLSKVVLKGINSVERAIIVNESKEKDPGRNRKLGTGLLSVMGTERGG